MEICITIPAYNEEETIGSVISNIKKVMDENKYDYKILVIDDGSKDNTSKIAKELGAIIFSHQNEQRFSRNIQNRNEKST